MMRVAFRLGASSILSLLVTLTGCQLLGASDEEPIPADSRIEFTAEGGFFGGVWHDLSISEDGLVTNRAVTPNLTRQLSTEEHQRLLDAFDGFAALPDQVGESACTDDVVFRVTVHQNGADQTSSVWGCALGEDERSQELERMRGIVTALSQLSQDIYDTQAPWRGLEAEFSTDRQVYHPGDPITLKVHVRNPTSGTRSLFFAPDAERIGFRLSRRNGPNFSFEYPARDAGPEQKPKALEEVAIGPGEEQVFTLVWNGVVPEAEGGAEILAPGEYALAPYLQDTSQRFYPDILVITVVDG